VYIISLHILCYIILLNLVIVSYGHRVSVVSLHYSLDTHDDVWELTNTAIEPLTVNRLPVSFKLEIGNWVKTGSGRFTS
jgi:hypothetical protein